MADGNNDGETEPGLEGEQDDDWQRVRLLAATVEDHELLDPSLAPERLIYRLFHEEGVRASTPRPIEARCQCSKDRVGGFLGSFDADELSEMRDDTGALTVTCEFCTKKYSFDFENLVGGKS